MVFIQEQSENTAVWRLLHELQEVPSPASIPRMGLFAQSKGPLSLPSAAPG